MVNTIQNMPETKIQLKNVSYFNHSENAGLLTKMVEYYRHSNYFMKKTILSTAYQEQICMRFRMR